MKGRARRDQLRAFWRLIRVGAVAEDAARRVGFEGSTGRRWFVQAGGMAPLSLVEPPRGRTLNIVEREQILAGIQAGESIRGIAGRLGRAPSRSRGS